MKRILHIRLWIASVILLGVWLYTWALNYIGMAYLRQEGMVAIRVVEAFLVLQWPMLGVPAVGVGLAFRANKFRKGRLLYVAPDLFVVVALFWLMAGNLVWNAQILQTQIGPLKRWRMIQQEQLMNKPYSDPRTNERALRD